MFDRLVSSFGSMRKSLWKEFETVEMRFESWTRHCGNRLGSPFQSCCATVKTAWPAYLRTKNQMGKKMKNKVTDYFFTSENDSRRRFHLWKIDWFKLFRTRSDQSERFSKGVFNLWMNRFPIQEQLPRTQNVCSFQLEKAIHRLALCLRRMPKTRSTRQIVLVFHYRKSDWKAFWQCLTGDEMTDWKRNRVPRNIFIALPHSCSNRLNNGWASK